MTNRPSRPGDGDDDGSLSEWTTSQDVQDAPRPSGETAFTPGTMLAGRYRIVALLGKGGMGEIYRADDTKLGQGVALKFLRGALSAELIERLYAEVRIGRQVSHPNVCRLYDVVEFEGHHFLAMEYVDGEDLASLLARIGRLPPDKALDIARDLCAGLAAVHDKGVVHRDLKPANVMIDGRGRARLTDFGLAIALETPGADAAAGTPAYMSPEQLGGKEVTFRSDLYALGLILYEMFTGRRFFDARTLEDLLTQHQQAKAPRLSTVSRLLDPTMERLILECLSEEVQDRPLSARAVAASLPGGDPLEAAMAAGETPSPEMVAAAGRVGDLGPAAAWTALLCILGGLILSASLLDKRGILRKALLPKTPEVLAERARDVLSRVGYADPPMDWAYSLDWDRAYVEHLVRGGSGATPWQRLREAPVSPFTFYYRQSPRKLIAMNRDGMVLRDDPPHDVSGMLEVVLDPTGRLTSLLAVPPEIESGQPPWPEPEWTALLESAGLDRTSLHVVEPRWASPVDSDRKTAWEEPLPGQPEEVVRVEAAAYHGRPVWFAVLPPWARPTRMEDSARPFSPTPVGQTGVWVLALAMPVGGVILARRNLRLGRGDRKAAFRVALFVFATYGLARLFRTDHVSAFGEELWILIRVLAYPSFWAAQVWLLYLALEPYARRRWPHVLISWKRLLSGQLRDPLVGRDVLLGGATGVMLVLMFVLGLLAPPGIGASPAAPLNFVDGPTLTSLRFAGFRLFVNQFSAVLFALVFLFMLVLLRVILRNQWLAMAAWCVLVGGPLAGESWFVGLARGAILLVLLTRGGLLPLAVALFYMFYAFEVPLTLDFSAWYATHCLPAIFVFVALALYGFHTSLAGKPLLGRSLLED